MIKTKKDIIDLFVSVVDNYGDMGFACEFIQKMQFTYSDLFEYIIWVDNYTVFSDFARQFQLDDVLIVDICYFGKLRKSAIGISVLHSPLPDLNLFLEKALILRIDYISLDDAWMEKNEQEHILSTQTRQIIELIPSPIQSGAGLLPIFTRKTNFNPPKGQHITIFSYQDSLDSIDFDTFPDDIIVYIFTKRIFPQKNIITLDFLPGIEFYQLLDTSEFVIIRGEVSFAHVIQSGVPFFWDIYKQIGGFPIEQSMQFLDLIQANSGYRELHQILNAQKNGKISYQNMREVLSDTGFKYFQSKNLMHTVKKYIDRFNNSI